MKKISTFVMNAMAPIFVTIAIFYLNFIYQDSKFLSDTGLYFSFSIFIVVAILSWCFNRSRVFFCSVAMFLVFFAISTAPDSLAYNNIAIFILIFIPLNFILFSFLKERGITSLWGGIKFLFIFIQIFFLYWWVYVEKKNFEFITKLQLRAERPNFLEIAFQNVSLFFLVAIIIFSLLIYKRRLIVDIAFIFTLLLIEAMVFLGDEISGRSIFFIGALLVLLIAVLQDSYNMAFHDELTTLPGRRALRNQMMKLSGKYTTAMLDIDFFKKFNDTYGHDVGDKVLKMVATVMKDVNGGGRVFRYGGEEFTIIFPGKSVNEAVPYLEELRENISKSQFTQKDSGKNKKRASKSAKNTSPKALHVTVSIGVAERNDKNRRTDEVLTAADRALYRAKKKGRNCVSK